MSWKKVCEFVSPSCGRHRLGVGHPCSIMQRCDRNDTPFLASRDDANTYACIECAGPVFRSSRIDSGFAVNTPEYLVCHPRNS